MKQQQFSPFLCAAAFALAVIACSDNATTPNPNTAAGVGGATAGAPGATAGTPGAAGTSAAGTTATVGRSGAAGTGTVTAGTGTGAAGTGAAGTAAAGTGAAGTAAAGTGAAAGASGGAAGGGGAAGSGATAGAGGATTGGMLGGALMYTGPFTMGMTIPPKNKCPMSVIGGGTGENKSPPLAWKGGPADTKSFAIVLFDTQYNMLHWVLWDIPVTVNELPEGLAMGYELTTPPGAHQAAGMMMDAEPHRYYGPCSSGARAGTYEYRLYALKTEKLTLTESSTAAQAQAAVEAAKLEMVAWSGKPM